MRLQILAGTNSRRFLGAVGELLHKPHFVMVLAWLLQLVLVSWILFFGGLNTEHGLITLQLSPDRMVEIYGFADAGSYLQAALNLIATGTSTPEWAWVLNLWPPGMVWLDATIIKISPWDFGVTFALITAFAWSLALAILAWPFIRTLKSAAIVVVVELAILGTSPFQSWMFDEGLFYADSLAVAMFLLGLALVVNRIRSAGPMISWIRDGILAGIAFASAIYLRASYNLVPWALGAVALLTLILLVVQRRRRDVTYLWRQAVLTGVAGLSVLFLALPYTVFLLQERDRAQFVRTEELVYEHAWEDPDVKTIPQWMLDGGSTVGCDIDPEQCAEFAKETASGVTHSPEELRDELIEAIVTHPGEFIVNRVSHVSTQWFADELSSYSRAETDYTSGPVTYAASHNYNVAHGLLYLALLVITFGSAIVLAIRGNWAMLIVPVLALAILAPFAIVHVEVRYLIPLKFIGLLAPLLVLMLWEQPTRRERLVESRFTAST